MFPITLPLQKVYPAQGRCIYCGSHGPNLTLEHIVPFALDGRLELPEASCGVCQKQTWWAESQLLENLLLGPRRFLKVRRRPKKGRPGIPQMGVFDRQPDGAAPSRMDEAGFRLSDLPEKERPVQITMPILAKPTLLGGPESPPGGLQMTGIGLTILRPAPPPADGKTGHMPFNKFEPSSLARSLCKIAHAATVAELGLGGFAPILPDYIRNRRIDYARVVGSTRVGRFKRDRTVHVSLHREAEWIVARIQIFAQFRTTPYSVVVGRASADDLFISTQRWSIAAR